MPQELSISVCWTHGKQLWTPTVISQGSWAGEGASMENSFLTMFLELHFPGDIFLMVGLWNFWGDTKEQKKTSEGCTRKGEQKEELGEQGRTGEGVNQKLSSESATASMSNVPYSYLTHIHTHSLSLSPPHQGLNWELFEEVLRGLPPQKRKLRW